MKIIIDTNVLRQDFFLRSPRFEMLRDFISKTDYKIVLPQVVFDEIISLYERALSEKYGSLKKAKNDIEKLLINKSIEISELNIQEQIDSFEKNLYKRLKLNKKSIIPLNNEHLPDLVKRAIKRIHPFSENKSEFRDALIWLTCLDLAEQEKHKTIILISENTKEFADKDAGLHKCLLTEADNKGVKVNYFSTLDDFLKTKASKIDFINEKWLEANIDLNELGDTLARSVERYGGKKLNEKARQHNNAFDEILSVNGTNTWINDYYVYEMADGSYRIEITLESELEVEFATHDVVVERWDTDYVYSPLTDDFDIEPVRKMETTSKAGYDYYYPVAEIEYHIVVKDKKN